MASAVSAASAWREETSLLTGVRGRAENERRLAAELDASGARFTESLTSLGRQLIPLGTDLVNALARFGSYAERYNAGLARVLKGENRWVDGLGVDSCQAVWMQLHEDLLASIGLDRGEERLIPWAT